MHMVDAVGQEADMLMEEMSGTVPNIRFLGEIGHPLLIRSRCGELSG